MRLTTTHKMGFAALIMAGSVFLSRLMGLVRDKVVSWQFGAGAESDVYFAAFVVPDFLNYLLAGGYISITLIPLLSKRFEENEGTAGASFPRSSGGRRSASPRSRRARGSSPRNWPGWSDRAFPRKNRPG
ncbi:MAG: lipid II flippase MurJ [Bilophila sp.]